MGIPNLEGMKEFFLSIIIMMDSRRTPGTVPEVYLDFWWSPYTSPWAVHGQSFRPRWMHKLLCKLGAESREKQKNNNKVWCTGWDLTDLVDLGTWQVLCVYSPLTDQSLNALTHFENWLLGREILSRLEVVISRTQKKSCYSCLFILHRVQGMPLLKMSRGGVLLAHPVTCLICKYIDWAQK